MRDTLARVRTIRPLAGRKLRLLVAVALMTLVNVAGPAIDAASAAPPSQVVWLSRDFTWTLRGPEIQCTNRQDSPFQTETTPAVQGGIGTATRTYSCTDSATGNRLSVIATFAVAYGVDNRANAALLVQTTYQPGGGAAVDCSGSGPFRSYQTNLLRNQLLTDPVSFWSQIRFETGGRATCDDGTPIETFFSFGEGVEAI